MRWCDEAVEGPHEHGDMRESSAAHDGSRIALALHPGYALSRQLCGTVTRPAARSPHTSSHSARSFPQHAVEKRRGARDRVRGRRGVRRIVLMHRIGIVEAVRRTRIKLELNVATARRAFFDQHGAAA